MIYTFPHYYNHFKCTASGCPDTCCAGWGIMIDRASLKKYRNMDGPFGSRLHNSIHWKEGSFKQYHGRCAFLNEENLCDIYSEPFGPQLFEDTARVAAPAESEVDVGACGVDAEQADGLFQKDRCMVLRHIRCR